MERHKDVEIIFTREGVWAHRLQKQSMLGGHMRKEWVSQLAEARRAEQGWKLSLGFCGKEQARREDS